MATEALRTDGKGYIDEAVSPPPAPPSPVPSGSSVEESSEAELDPPTWKVAASSSSSSSPRPEEADYEEDEWDVETEDWELANGDFTKQYNRMRQQTSAMTVGSTFRPPLPTRNPNTSLGVASNPKSSSQTKDKANRATQDQVLDSRTRLVLSGLVNRGIIGSLERCISTGKEAAVYLSNNVAVKIYRTSILSFRSRQEYIQGEHRFQGEYSSAKNPRKMVRVWAEKELRNLRRLEQGGVLCPKVIDCKENVLAMEYLGTPDAASPRLKDALIPEDEMGKVYNELLETVRRIYQVCKLVHADLSEYNILYHDSHPYIIDVSQSVEQDHPRSFDFLRHDLHNVKDFFTKRGVTTFSLKQTWDYVTEPGAPDLSEMTPEEDVDDTVFKSQFIPKSLAELYDPERDAAAKVASDAVAEAEEADQADSSSSDEPDDEGGDESQGPSGPRGFRHEDREAKKERKKAVKEAQRERRQQKMAKSEKQRIIKKTSRK